MQTPRRKGHAVGDRRSHLRFWIIAAVGLALDLASKAWAWRTLGPPPPDDLAQRVWNAVPGWLRFVTSENSGIVFGFDFATRLGLGPAAGIAVTVALTLVTCGLIFYVFATSRPGQWLLHVWCALVLAGAVGNLYDRLAFGYVRDFIQITREVTVAGRTFAWPYVFNVADVYLVVGVIGIAAMSLFGGRPRPAEAPAEEPGHADARP